MQAMVMFGAPPERIWPYAVSKYEDEPDAYAYAAAQSFQALRYYRLDPPGKSPADLLVSIKTSLAAGLPVMFGFSVYSSMGSGAWIPFPAPSDRLVGGHAVVAIGYDDSQASLLIRNSWGTTWGDRGYGRLPYDYVLRGLADDFWSLSSAEFVDTDLFK